MPKPMASPTCRLLAGEAARALEPALNCDAALLSPSTGIIDSHAYMLALRGDAEEAGAAFAFHTPLLRARAAAGRIEIEAGGDAPMTLECDLLVNAAGLGAPAVARSIEGMPIELIPPAYLAKGNYFSCSARAPFSRLIYPVPEPGGLGVHLTLDMAGQARFGPDVEWVETHRLRRRSGAGGAVLSGDPALLADAAGRRADAELFRNPAEDRAAGGGHAGFPDPGAARPRRRRADQPVRHRIAGTDVVAGDRGPCRRIGGAVASDPVRSSHNASPYADERISAHPAAKLACSDTLLESRLVECFAGGMLQPLDLVLDHQLSALQLDNLQVVCGKVHERFVQFVFENLVFTFKFNEMRLYCHTKSPRWVKPQIRSGRGSVHQPPNLSMGIENCGLSYFRIYL